MDKKLVMLSAVTGMTIGGALPLLFGDSDPLSGWGILGGLIGGFIGIWCGVKLMKRYG